MTTINELKQISDDHQNTSFETILNDIDDDMVTAARSGYYSIRLYNPSYEETIMNLFAKRGFVVEREETASHNFSSNVIIILKWR